MQLYFRRMSLTLLNQNACTFLNCGLYFQNVYDLIAHIEFAHIPLVEDENRRKGVVAPSSEDNRVTVAPNMPLSCFQRVFPTPYRPIPCAPQVIKISFNHYRRRPPLQSHVNPINLSAQPNSGSYFMQTKKEDGFMNAPEEKNGEECAPNDPEIRYRCTWVDCGRRFKSGLALRKHIRQHLRTIHNTIANDDGSNVLSSNPITSVLEAPPVASPTKYAQSRPHKCGQCSKRYKTIQGLQNHVSHSHQKLNGSNTPDNNSPSPAALAQLIIQKTQSHVQQTERSSCAQHGNRQLSNSTVSGNQVPSEIPLNTSIPASRTIPAQSGRMSHQQSFSMQTTGQMLKQQMHRQQSSTSYHLNFQQEVTKQMVFPKQEKEYPILSKGSSEIQAINHENEMQANHGQGNQSNQEEISNNGPLNTQFS